MEGARASLGCAEHESGGDGTGFWPGASIRCFGALGEIIGNTGFDSPSCESILLRWLRGDREGQILPAGSFVLAHLTW